MGYWKIARAGRPDDNPLTRATQAAAFTASAKSVGGASLFAGKTESGLVTWMAASDHPMESQVAFKLAQAVGGRSEAMDDPPIDIAETTHIAYLRAGSGFFRSAQMGADDTALAKALAQTIWPGNWVGVSFRHPTKREQKRQRKWLSGRGNVPGAAPRIATANAVVASIWAGADSAESAQTMLGVTAASMPGLEVEVQPHIVTRASAWLGLPLVVAGVSVSVATAAFVIFGLTEITAALGALAIAGFAPWLFRGMLFLPSEWKSASDALSNGTLPVPPQRRGLRPPKPPRPARLGPDNVMTDASDGDYPLHRESLLLEPGIFVPIASPQGGADADSTAHRAVPPALLRRIGPRFGTSPTGGEVWLPADLGFHGTAIVGRPGSGKTASLLGLAGWYMLERARPDVGFDNGPGDRQAIVAFESKDSAGANEYVEWGSAAGLNVPVVEVGAASGPVIDLFAGSGSVWDRASRFAGAMQYAFGEGAIQSRSLKALRVAFAAALLIPEGMLKLVPELAAGSSLSASGRFSVCEVAHILLGGKGDAVGVKLANLVTSEHARLSKIDPANPVLADLKSVSEFLAPYYAGRTETQRRNLIDAAESKVEELLNLPEWWSRERPSVAWSDILEQHRVVVINLGTAADGGTVMEQTKARLGGMLMATLQESIEATCADWYSKGRGVAIFADELKLLAEFSSGRIEWLRNQGRSYGVRLHLATQYADQLVQSLRTAFMSFGTLISYVQADVTTAKQTAEQIGGGSDEWTAQDVLHLEPWHAIIRTTHEGRVQPAFVVGVLNFVALRSSFVEMQGYDTTATTNPPSAVEPGVNGIEPAPPGLPLSEYVDSPVGPAVPGFDAGVSNVDLSRELMNEVEYANDWDE